jgi:glycosyltransferase involved in cell wall biosynthesis
MNIWFAADISSESHGGIARSMQGFAEGLRRLGHQTAIVKNTPCHAGGFLAFSAMVAFRLFRERKNPPDWIIARSTDGLGCAIVAKALGLKTRVALHNHGWEENAYEIERRLPRDIVIPKTTWRARLVRFPLLRASLSRSACCLCGTITEIKWLKKKYPRHERKFRYVPNGVEMPDKGYWIERRYSPLHFLAIGGPTWKKNLSHTIAVFTEITRELPESRLFLVGGGTERSLSAHRLPEGTTVVPDVAPQEMARWYTTCPYIISSSRYEGGHSFALLEAMSHGCIAIASAVFSSMEIVTDRHNGVLIAGVDAFADSAAVVAVLREKELVASMRRHAFFAARRHRWERQIKRLERALCRS